MSEHTPIPWCRTEIIKIKDECGDRYSTWKIVANTEGAPTDIGFIEDEGDADFMVRAVNCHDALFKALREMIYLYGDNEQYDDSEEQFEIKAIAAARAAIAKATGE